MLWVREPLFAHPRIVHSRLLNGRAKGIQQGQKRLFLHDFSDDLRQKRISWLTHPKIKFFRYLGGLSLPVDR